MTDSRAVTHPELTSAMTDIAIGSDEWLLARRSLITATDIPVILGLSPWKSEADLADEKLGKEALPPTVRMRIGLALEPLIATLYMDKAKRTVWKWETLAIHPNLPWAAASPDYYVPGERLVEIKRYARSAVADALPQHVEAQVQWQLGVTGYDVADVAVLAGDELLDPFEVTYSDEQFADLVAIAEDFRERLRDGGPFAVNADRIKRDFPADDGSTVTADPDVDAAVRELITIRGAIKALEQKEEALETAIKARMADHAVLQGTGYRITWKRTKDVETTDWKSLASGLLSTLAEPERSALVGIHTTVRAGFRPFRVVQEGDPE